MKWTLNALLFSLICLSATAQHRQQDSNNSSMMKYPALTQRTEIILPEVNGYKIIKADLHVHTFFSDGNMAPSYRIFEGWRDGLDVMAITDHIEYRPNEKSMKQYFADQIIEKDAASWETPKVDLNASVSAAVNQAKQMGITLISGTEITRDPVNVGHFNALFTTDNNLIPDPDPLTAIRNAKKNGAIVQCNHPGWRRPDNEYTDVAKAAIAEGLIDGVEVFNGAEFYPDVIESAIKSGFYVSSNTDIHSSSFDNYGCYGHFRNMTFLLAKDASPESVRDALENKRTLAYAFGDIAGDEQLLKDFFNASFDIKLLFVDGNGRKHFMITNKTSLPFTLRVSDATVDAVVNAFSSVIWKTTADKLRITAKSMWYGPDKHPSFEFPAE